MTRLQMRPGLWGFSILPKRDAPANGGSGTFSVNFPIVGAFKPKILDTA
jgi:hypothetical protein